MLHGGQAGIRGACASASLKLVGSEQSKFCFVLYPRRMRLGLIEAVSIVPGVQAGLRSIRGACASASLKRARIAHDFVWMGKKYPRRMRLGLIEAQEQCRRAGAHPCRIRGACASASLKLLRVQCRHRRVTLYPRRMRLGLIEAPLSARAGRPRNIVSEAHAPRPH